jgi:hypothetical protein
MVFFFCFFIAPNAIAMGIISGGYEAIIGSVKTVGNTVSSKLSSGTKAFVPNKKITTPNTIEYIDNIIKISYNNLRAQMKNNQNIVFSPLNVYIQLAIISSLDPNYSFYICDILNVDEIKLRWSALFIDEHLFPFNNAAASINSDKFKPIDISSVKLKKKETIKKEKLLPTNKTTVKSMGKQTIALYNIKKMTNPSLTKLSGIVLQSTKPIVFHDSVAKDFKINVKKINYNIENAATNYLTNNNSLFSKQDDKINIEENECYDLGVIQTFQMKCVWAFNTTQKLTSGATALTTPYFETNNSLQFFRTKKNTILIQLPIQTELNLPVGTQAYMLIRYNEESVKPVTRIQHNAFIKHQNNSECLACSHFEMPEIEFKYSLDLANIMSLDGQLLKKNSGGALPKDHFVHNAHLKIDHSCVPNDFISVVQSPQLLSNLLNNTLTNSKPDKAPEICISKPFSFGIFVPILHGDILQEQLMLSGIIYGWDK